MAKSSCGDDVMAVTGVPPTVTARQTLAALVATLVALAALVVVVRSEGLPAIDASSSRATRWFVHEQTGRIVLVDGFGGRALASLEPEGQTGGLFVAEGAGQAFVLDDATASVRTIDTAELRLGPSTGLSTLGDGVAVARAGSSGLLVANPSTGDATLVPTGGDPVDLTFTADDAPGTDLSTTLALAPDGSIWSLVDGALVRSASNATTTVQLGLTEAALSLVGNDPLVVDRLGRRVRLGSGRWVDLPGSFDGSELVVQRAGPQADCGWVGVGDELWCVGTDGIDERASIAGLRIGGGDILAIAGDAAALIRRGPTDVVQFDWREQVIVRERQVSVAGSSVLDVTATTDVIWIDDRSGDLVWSIHPWGIQEVDKNPSGVLVLGDDGDVIDTGESANGDRIGAQDGSVIDAADRVQDAAGIDDPPVAKDDYVTARSGASVPIAVTVNDYDPDGEAVAVGDVASPGHGRVEIATASTIVYSPEQGYVGLDRFEYTIVDGAGQEAVATVTVELLAADATNRPPLGSRDTAEVGPGRSVVVDVLLNDIDPERDALRIEGFSAPSSIGKVTETVGPSGLAALEFTPVVGFEGTATFSYRPVDSFGAVGAPVDVDVDVARAGAVNRAPIARPDAVRTRRGTEAIVQVLINDVDPDGDPLLLDVVRPLPDGLSVVVRGDHLAVTPTAGSGETVSFEYEVDDGQGNTVVGSVLVVVLDESEANRPPLVAPDFGTAVVGQSILIDVTANDTDPDGDPLVVTAVTQPGRGGSAQLAGGNRIEFTAASINEDTDANVRFAYTVNDGNGHAVDGEVTVTVLSAPLPEPPYARNDSTFTYMNQPVTIDVLRNDGDPSGERPTIAGTPGCPAGGTATVTADSQVRFDPPTGQVGAFRCNYEVTNSRDLRASAAILISVREPALDNQPPIARTDSLTIPVGTSVNVDVTANDSDPDGDSDSLRVVSSTQPLVGSATRNGNDISFTAGVVPGVATITYVVEDEVGAAATGRLQISIVNQTNLAPIARPDTKRIDGLGIPATIDVLANDTDPDSSPVALSVVAVSLVAGSGTLTRAGSLVTVAPDPSFVGDLTGAYTISDGEDTASSTFTFTVVPPANGPPVANDDATSVPNGGGVTTAVLLNDLDPDGDPLSVSIISGPDPSLGTVDVIDDRAIRFDARPGASGVALIVYEVSDGELTDTATLRITVATCQASIPIARDVFLETGYQQPIAIDLDEFAANGQVVDVSGPATYQGGIYTPPAGMNGNATITFSVRNDCGQRTTGTVTVDVNQSPVGQDRALTLGRGEVVELPVSQLGSDREPLVISSSSGAPSWVTTTADGVTIAVPVDSDYAATGWTTTLSDPGGLTVTVNIAVTVANVAPTAVADSLDASGGLASWDIVLNDADPDGSNSDLRIQSIPGTLTFSNGQDGVMSVDGTGRIVTIDPRDGRGTASFEYSVIDAGGATSSPTTVIVVGPTVPPPNNPPVASDQSVTVTAGEITTISLDVSDADGDPLTIIVLSDPSGVVVTTSGQMITILAPSEGSYDVRYRVSDGKDTSNPARLEITAGAPTVTTTTSVPSPPTTS